MACTRRRRSISVATSMQRIRSVAVGINREVGMIGQSLQHHSRFCTGQGVFRAEPVVVHTLEIQRCNAVVAQRHKENTFCTPISHTLTPTSPDIYPVPFCISTRCVPPAAYDCGNRAAAITLNASSNMGKRNHFVVMFFLSSLLVKTGRYDRKSYRPLPFIRFRLQSES